MTVKGVMTYGNSAARVRRVTRQGQGLGTFEGWIGADAFGDLFFGSLCCSLFGFKSLCNCC